MEHSTCSTVEVSLYILYHKMDCMEDVVSLVLIREKASVYSHE